ncbi:hypothetical protein HYPSUDRAFT_207623 [Hypholoma sublateritium FD-334 SS-4]|uniref:Uncharacterized protein n=1 Tax=Hypholoma sublateritium (strain FD-334 SS-4) TaxID=945553 RepID=A0A0D2LY22_HYPSF|nr:hypothetical protein HYPSUDRAFT_207623 [Hypholoma sublateritium FD-334 SS-4]
MQQQFRAGLLGIILTLLLVTVFTAAAPILPHRTTSVASPSRDVSINPPVAQFPAPFLGNGLKQVNTVEKMKNAGHSKEADTLYRRNIFKKIGHAFKSIGKKIGGFVKNNLGTIVSAASKVA